MCSWETTLSATKAVEESLELAEAAGQDTVLVLTEELKHLVLENELLRQQPGTKLFLDRLDDLTEHWEKTRNRQVDVANRLLDQIAQLQRELQAERNANHITG